MEQQKIETTEDLLAFFQHNVVAAQEAFRRNALNLDINKARHDPSVFEAHTANQNNLKTAYYQAVQFGLSGARINNYSLVENASKEQARRFLEVMGLDPVNGIDKVPDEALTYMEIDDIIGPPYEDIIGKMRGILYSKLLPQIQTPK